MSTSSPRVAILMGSDSDWPVMKKAHSTLSGFGVASDVRVISAHRRPTTCAEYASAAAERGISVIIAGAGLAAHLPGVVAAHTTLPVIGVPIESKLDGLDSLLSIVQMPPGVPVATVGIGRAENAALLALQMIALADPDIAAKVADHKREIEAKATAADEKLQAAIASEA